MNFGERLRTLRKQKDFTQYQVAQQIGVKKNTISNYEKNISKPHYEQLVKLCDLFKCSPNTLMSNDVTLDEEVLTPADKQILDQYHSLSKTNKSIVDYILEMEDESVGQAKIYYFPVFFQSAAAGIGQLSETDEYQMEELKLKQPPANAMFGMYIKGNSMETTIFENDIVLIDPSQVTPNELDNEIVVALFGNELVCKKISINSDMQTYNFFSNNPKARDKSRLNQKQSSFRLIGKVVKVIHAHETGIGLFTYSED